MQRALALRAQPLYLAGALVLYAIVGAPIYRFVLTLAVDQRRGVCGHGHGTRLVNGLKALLAARAASMRATSAVLLAQADLGEQVMSARMGTDGR